MAVIACACPAVGGSNNPEIQWIELRDGRLIYGADSELDHIPNFSTVGYEEGDAPIPDVPVRAYVEAAETPTRPREFRAPSKPCARCRRMSAAFAERCCWGRESIALPGLSTWM